MAYKAKLAQGLPIVRSVGRHLIIIRGAVIGSDGQVKWTICNDPYGNLATETASALGYSAAQNKVNLFGSGDDETRIRGKHVYYQVNFTARNRSSTIVLDPRIYINVDQANAINVPEKLVTGAAPAGVNNAAIAPTRTNPLIFDGLPRTVAALFGYGQGEV